VRSLLVTNIGELITADPAYGEGPLGIRRDAALVIEDRRVEWIGRAKYTPQADAMLDANGAAVLPGFVDSHAHLVFAGDRAGEFAARMAGERYSGGGIRMCRGCGMRRSDRVRPP
jgi:imidazolonepropionase